MLTIIVFLMRMFGTCICVSKPTIATVLLSLALSWDCGAAEKAAENPAPQLQTRSFRPPTPRPDPHILFLAPPLTPQFLTSEICYPPHLTNSSYHLPCLVFLELGFVSL
ncbi:hypothetical protein V8F06_000376 [Rhypophila decipiens]